MERATSSAPGRAPRIAVDSSLFDETALADWLLATFDLGPSVSCRLISRSMNDTFRVMTPLATFFLRVTPHGWRTRQDIASELAFIRAADEQGVRVANPIPRRDGATISPLAAPEGERLAVLFAAVPGTDNPEITIDQSRAYGRLAAKLHEVADAQPQAQSRPEIGPKHLLDEPLAAIRETFSAATSDLDYLEAMASRVRVELIRMLRTAPEFGLCHGDLHPGNVRFDDSGTPALFDFDLAGNGWRMYDLTVFLWNAFGERRPRRWRDSRWRAFLGGYQELRPLAAAALEAVPLFLVARQLWLIGVDCRRQGGWPVQWLNARYLTDMIDPIRSWEAEFPILKADTDCG
jgi:Ser/Thr protein kinase RdoA (MazF antagonist)